MLFFKQKIAGFFKYYGLSDWWLTSFSNQEKKLIISVISAYRSLSSDVSSLTKGEYLGSAPPPLSFTSSNSNMSTFLCGLAHWFKKPETYQIAKRLIEKAEEYVAEIKSVSDLHFYYLSKIEIYYRNRETESDALEKAITACEQQIAISEKVAKVMKKENENTSRPGLPMHTGFQQLAIIREKQKDYEAIIRISEQALKEGWGGDWERRIEKAKKKLGI